MKEAKLRDKLYQLQGRRYELDEQIQDVKDALYEAQLAGYPSEPGWYEDAEGHIARLYITTCGNRVWDDGWGNDEFGLPELPVTKLEPVEEQR